MSRSYTIWLQPTPGKSITSRENPPDVFHFLMTENERRGMMRTFQVMTTNDTKAGQRIQIQTGIDPPIDLSILRMFQTLYPGTFVVNEVVHPMYLAVPTDYSHEDVNSYFLTLKPFKELPDYYVLPFHDFLELKGAAFILEWLKEHGVTPELIRLEDNQGNIL